MSSDEFFRFWDIKTRRETAFFKAGPFTNWIAQLIDGKWKLIREATTAERVKLAEAEAHWRLTKSSERSLD